MICPGCRSGGLVEICVQLEGTRITMHSCSVCEARWWDRDGEVVGLGNVLSMVPRRVQAA
jgi:hypothetical protein